MPKVFVTQESGRHNICHAMEFGDIEVITDRDYPMFKEGSSTLGDINRKLSFFLPDDYLLLSGDPVVIGLSFSVLAKSGIKVLKVLKWDRQANRYIPINVPL